MSKRITTDKRAEAARINGAKSRGPKTPEGKVRSSQNSLKHGGYARCALLLANEEAPIFDSFRESFIARFQPADPVEISLVDEMVFARWRMRRFWFAQDVTIDLEMMRQEPLIEEEFDEISEPGRLSRAFTTLVDDSRTLDFLYRVESRCTRQFHRAMKDLLHLQSLRQPPASASQTPEIKNEQTNPSPTQPSPDQRITPPASAHFRPVQPPCTKPPSPNRDRQGAVTKAASLSLFFFAAIFVLILFSARALALSTRVSQTACWDLKLMEMLGDQNRSGKPYDCRTLFESASAGVPHGTGTHRAVRHAAAIPGAKLSGREAAFQFAATLEDA